MRGVKKIYAIKQHSEAYNEMVKNIRLNELNETNTPINVTIASFDSFTVIPSHIDVDSTTSKRYGESGPEGFRVYA